MSTDYFETFCTKCGATDDPNDAVTVTRTEQENVKTNPNLTLSQDLLVEFHCANCDIEESVDTGIYPEGHTDYFESRVKPDDKPTTLTIDGTEVHYKEIDEQVVESALIRHADITTSRIHHVHIRAVNPPTFTTNSAHHVVIEGYLDQKMMLGDVRYHDSKYRTLRFFRGLDDGIIETMNSLGNNDR